MVFLWGCWFPGRDEEVKRSAFVIDGAVGGGGGDRRHHHHPLLVGHLFGGGANDDLQERGDSRKGHDSNDGSRRSFSKKKNGSYGGGTRRRCTGEDHSSASASARAPLSSSSPPRGPAVRHDVEEDDDSDEELIDEPHRRMGTPRRRRRMRDVEPERLALLVTPLDALLPPTYRLVSRSRCRLLQLCYEQRWEGVMNCLEESSRHRHEVYCRTNDTYRTALHLSTLPGTVCPPQVLVALVRANLHAVTVRDKSPSGRTQPLVGGLSSTKCGSSTPLHFLCGGRHKNNLQVVQLFVDAALCYENRDAAGRRNAANALFRHRILPPAYMYSPLFVVRVLCAGNRCYAWNRWGRCVSRRAASSITVPQSHPLARSSLRLVQACRNNARPETIRILVEATHDEIAPPNGNVGTNRIVAPWIAPVTGAEPFQEDEAVASARGWRFDLGPGANANDVMMAPPKWVPLAELWKHSEPFFQNADWSDPDVVARLRQVVLSQLPNDEVDESISEEPTPESIAASSTVVVDDLTRAWMSIIHMFRPHVISLSNLLQAVVNNAFPSTVPIVALYEIMCRLFPELLMERDLRGRVPLHCALHRTLYCRPPSTSHASSPTATWPPVSTSVWTHQLLPGLVRSSIIYRPDCATVMDPSIQLFPALLAAIIDAPLSTVYELVLASAPTLFGVTARMRR